MDQDRAGFDADWQRLRPALERMLRCRGVPFEDIEDALQETALRFLAHWDRLDLTRSLNQLARAIAVNYIIDRHRTRHDIPIAELPERASDYDLEQHALSRLRLHAVSAALHQLRPNDRAILLDQLQEATRGSTTTSAVKMARLRARARLRGTLDRATGAFGILQLTGRRLWTWVQQSLTASPYTAVPALTTAAGLAAVSILTLSTIGHRDVSAPQKRAERAHGLVAFSHASARSTIPEASLFWRPMQSFNQSPRPHSPREHGSHPSDEMVTEAGPARARTGTKRGQRYASVCIGSDGAWIVIYDGSQDSKEDPETCGDGKKNKRKKDSDDPQRERVERKAEADYILPAADINVSGQGAFVCTPGNSSRPGIGCVNFSPEPEEIFMHVSITDSSGMPIAATVGQIEGESVTICGASKEPIPILEGQDIFVRILPFDPSCTGIPTSGTAAVTFSNLP